MSVDRLRELRKKKGISLAVSDGEVPNDAIAAEEARKLGDQQIQIVAENGSDDVDLQIQLYKPINALIEEIRKSTEQLDVLRGKDARSSDDKTRKKIMGEMTETVNKVMTLSGDVKNALMEIKSMNDKFDAEDGNQNSARSQVRNNLYQATVRRFQEHAAEFAESREAFRQSVQGMLFIVLFIVLFFFKFFFQFF